MYRLFIVEDDPGIANAVAAHCSIRVKIRSFSTTKR